MQRWGKSAASKGWRSSTTRKSTGQPRHLGTRQGHVYPNGAYFVKNGLFMKDFTPGKTVRMVILGGKSNVR